jgi:hypothetical protein
MTSYNTTGKVENAHAPWIIFSDRYTTENNYQHYLSFHLSLSHAMLTPELAEGFLNKFTLYAETPPTLPLISLYPLNTDFMPGYRGYTYTRPKTQNPPEDPLKSLRKSSLFKIDETTKPSKPSKL